MSSLGLSLDRVSPPSCRIACFRLFNADLPPETKAGPEITGGGGGGGGAGGLYLTLNCHHQNDSACRWAEV